MPPPPTCASEFHEAWERNHIVGANHLCLRRREIAANRGNSAVTNMNVAAANLAELRVHREDVRVLDDELTALGQSAGNTSSHARSALCRSCRTGRQRHSPQRSPCTEKISPGHFNGHTIASRSTDIPRLNAAISKSVARANGEYTNVFTRDL